MDKNLTEKGEQRECEMRKKNENQGRVARQNKGWWREKSRGGVEFGAESKEMSKSSAIQLEEILLGSKNKIIVVLLHRCMQMTQFSS